MRRARSASGPQSGHPGHRAAADGGGRRRPAGARPVAVWLALLPAVLATVSCDRAPEPGRDAGQGAVQEATTDSATGPGSVPAPEATPPTAAIDSAVRPGYSSADLTGFDTVYVYFTGPEEEQVPVPRPVPDTAHALRAAFHMLLEGPTAAEREAGLHSWFSEETAGMLRAVRVADGFAVVDFEDLRPVIPNAVGSAGALMLLGELQATAFQFPTIRRAEFRIEDDCAALMAWLQFGCYPIRRSGWDSPPGFRTAVRSTP